ncbi:DUF3034 family protein [Thermodesulforhabdus norvegica]|uniref:DUF3034 family protein n=1 Tax=Thermodesulforhabdus norvegica TaxID=39841 RepID=A0A1I4QYF6_9BACT|nr:DUF3034 family protein [Thermodesulforhabdus norvegica]SFM44750.1 Protein of unknown function [Thermodesulforhabdus norvegica]
MKKLISTMIMFCAFSCLVVQADAAPPLPLHNVEGFGGVAITGTAYLVNPPEDDRPIGMPAVGGGFVYTPKGRTFGFSTFTVNLFNRLELGYAFNVLNLHDLPLDVAEATGIEIANDRVFLHNLNARFNLIPENGFNLSWMPALTAGIHYKKVEKLSDIDETLGGALTDAGIEDTDGIDFTLYASKMLTFLPRPVLLNLGLRNSEAAHIGLLGFTGDREFLLEGSVIVFVTDRFLVGAEYRQKPNNYRPIPGLVEPEDDWWSVVAAFIVNDRLTISGGIFNFGEVLNHYDNGAVGLKLKFEF